MSLHCPSCGTADDGTANGYLHRAWQAEGKLDDLRTLVAEWREDAGHYDDLAGVALRMCAAQLERMLDNRVNL